MKKLILILLTSVITISLTAQGKIAYIVFTSQTMSSRGEGSKAWISKRHFKTPWGENFYTFKFINRDLWINYETDLYTFVNKLNRLDEIPAEMKPKSFLKTIDYIDWDVEAQKWNEAQARAKYKEFESCDFIYFIDRLDFTSDSVKVIKTVQVKGLM